MTSVKDPITHEIEQLSETELNQVAEYLAFLKFRARPTPKPLDEASLAALYGEFADEDRQLAEEGMEDHLEGLAREDAA